MQLNARPPAFRVVSFFTARPLLACEGTQPTVEMRKRKYAHNSNYARVEDCLTEIIDTFYEHAATSKRLRFWNEIQSTNSTASACAERVPVAQIHNLVGTAKVWTDNSHFNLEMISRLLPNCTYDKQKFAAITIRLYDPLCTVLLFTSGKMVLTGCRSFAECCWGSHCIVNFLRIGMPQYHFKLCDIKIQNIVGNVDLHLGPGQRMNLHAMYDLLSVFCTFQKNMFPGLIYRANNSPVVLLIFQSGKIVITGGKTSRDIVDGWNQLWPQVKQFIENS